MAVCIVILIGVLFAWVRIRWLIATISDKQVGSDDKEKMEADGTVRVRV
jgi:hypothetical protein